METKDATRRREPASIAFPAICLSFPFHREKRDDPKRHWNSTSKSGISSSRIWCAVPNPPKLSTLPLP